VNGSSKNTSVNAILMALVGLLIGFIGGYWAGRGTALPAGNVATQATQAECPHSLAQQDRYILAGLRCPGTDASQVLLLDCHCPTAHGIMDQCKSELAAGKSGEVIREEIMQQYGDKLKFAGQ
jgi:cytochrome c-type biogenesis protein CcmH/NrfF